MYGSNNMSLDIQKDKIQLSSVTHSLRAVQAVLQYGVGAMVDFPDQTLMTAAPEYWQNQIEEIHDERLERVLHVSHFGMPGNKGDLNYQQGISYVRFPEWYFCPRCRRFQPISKWVEEFRQRSKAATDDPYMAKHMKCPKCNQELIVTRVVTVCEDGHIDDFPWVKWVHCQNYYGHRDICSNPTLEFMTSKSSSEGLDAIEIRCSCGARASLNRAFDKNIFEELDRKLDRKYDFSCKGRHPWKHKHESCNRYPRTMQRGSSSVYFPYIESSLVIPPYSNILTSRIEESQAYKDGKNALNTALNIPGLPDDYKKIIKENQISNTASQIALEISAPENKVKEVLIRKWLVPTDEEEYSTSSVKYRAEEYEALNGSISLSSEDYGDFMLENTAIEDYKIPFIKKVSLIHKIREVQALTGFTRLTPAEKDPESKVPTNLVNIKEPQTDWYPAYQVRGEGIFIEFDQNAIDDWRRDNEDLKKRVSVINENYANSYFGKNNPRVITDKYLLLHTISHLLIKQLSFECGYSIASLKERIYCSEPEEGKEMACILVYTASGDSEGTLGGLVRQGRADLLPNLFKKAIESAVTCSNDPVCGLSLGQGRDSLNLAACYSCTLIPETSCEVFNIFLDRGAVVGTFENRNMGFYSKCLYGEKGWNYNDRNNEALPKVAHKRKLKEIVVKQGTDVSEMTYDDIWESIIKWLDDDNERKVLEDYVNNSLLFANKEKPETDCDFIIAGEDETYTCDLAWRKSKVLFFTSVNEEDYNAAKGSDWKCFLSLNGTTAQEIIKEVKDN